MEYTKWEYDENRDEAGNTYPTYTLTSEPFPDGSVSIRMIPVQAIADRMELYGLASVEESLSFLTACAQFPDLEREIIPPVHAAYQEVVQSEHRALLEAQARPVRDLRAQTVLAVGAAPHSQQTALAQARSSALQRLGLRGVRQFQASAAVAQGYALPIASQVVADIATQLGKNEEMVQTYRLLTAASFVPQLQEALTAAAQRAATEQEEIV